jgi:general secretion pathway protein D
MTAIIRKPYLLICLLLTLASTGHAQQAATPPIVPIVPLEPRVENPDEIIGLIVLSDETALQVLDMLEKMTGKIILRRQDIAAVKINFNSRGELTKGEAVLALESLLSLNSIMLTDMGGRFMKAVPATSVNSHVPEMIVGSTLGLPASQQIYAKLFKFDYLQAEATSGTTVTPLLSQNSSVIVFPKSNAMLITDALINLQRIERIIDEMDKPQEIREEIQFIKLNYVQATEMQQRIENLITGPLKNYLEGTTSVTADERTNQLILITHPGNLDVIMNVIESVDVDAAPLTSSEVFPLRQAQAVDVVSIIDEIISGQKEGREEDAKVAKDNKKTEKKADTPNLPNAKPNAAASANTTPGNASNSSLQFSNFVGLSADERTNAIVAYGTHSDLKTLGELINLIDRPLPQVRIEAIITQVQLEDNESRGIDSFNLDYNLTSLGDAGAPGGNEVNVSGTTEAGSIAAMSLKDFSLDLVLKTAESQSNVRVLSTPIIVVSHNQEATINVSQSRPIVTSSTSSLNNSSNNTRSSVEYRDIGIQLTVKPLIGSDGTVQMEVEQLIEDVLGEVEIDGNEQPIIGKREATSYLSVRDRDVIVLGGLQENRQKIGNGSLEGLGDLPLIGGLFSSKRREYTRTELIIFIQPTILTNPSDAAQDTTEQINAAMETYAVRKYLETSDMESIYVEESAIPAAIEKREAIEFEAEQAKLPIEEREPKKRSFFGFGDR